MAGSLTTTCLGSRSTRWHGELPSGPSIPDERPRRQSPLRFRRVRVGLGAGAPNECQSVPPGVGPPPRTPPVAGVWGLSGTTPTSTWAEDARVVEGEGTPPKIPLFHGEPGEWPSYYFAFRQVVNGMRLSNAQRKQRLLQSLRGKAAAYLLAKPHATHFSFRRLLKEWAGGSMRRRPPRLCGTNCWMPGGRRGRPWTNLRNAFSAWSSWLSPHCRIEPMPPSQSIAFCGAVQRKPPQQSL